MAKEIIAIKMSGELLGILYQIYDDVFYQYPVLGTDHTQLMMGHIVEFRDKLHKMVEKDQQRNTLSFGLTESIAFVQLWEEPQVTLKEYEAQVIRMIFEKLDKKAKSPQHSTQKAPQYAINR